MVPKQPEDAPQATFYTTPADLSILVCGECGFGHTLSICKALKDPTKVIATTLDTSVDETCSQYKRAADHIKMLEKLGVTILFRINATKLSGYGELKGITRN